VEVGLTLDGGTDLEISKDAGYDAMEEQQREAITVLGAFAIPVYHTLMTHPVESPHVNL